MGIAPDSKRISGLLPLCASLLVCLGVIGMITLRYRSDADPQFGDHGPGQERVEELIRAFTSDDAAVRDQASKSLLRALREDPKLRQILAERAGREKDIEVRTRLESVLREAAEFDLARLKLTPHAVLEGEDEDTFLHAAFSPEGRLLATLTQGDDVRLRLWSVKEAKPLGSAPVQSSVFQGLAFTPDGKEIVLTSARRITFFDPRTLKETRAIALRAPQGWMIHQVAVHPEGRILAFTESDALINRLTSPPSDVVLTTLEGAEIRRIRGSYWGLKFLQWSPDGRALVADSTHNGYRAVLLDGRTLEEMATIPTRNPSGGGMELTLNTAFLKEGGLLLTSSLSNLSIWSASPLELRATVLGCFPHPLWTAGHVFATATSGGVSVGTFLPSRNEIRIFGKIEKAESHCGALSPDGQWLMVTNGYQATKARLFRIQPD